LTIKHQQALTKQKRKKKSHGKKKRTVAEDVDIHNQYPEITIDKSPIEHRYHAEVVMEPITNTESCQ
jgi:hypothetical protein